MYPPISSSDKDFHHIRGGKKKLRCRIADLTMKIKGIPRLNLCRGWPSRWCCRRRNSSCSICATEPQALINHALNAVNDDELHAHATGAGQSSSGRGTKRRGEALGRLIELTPSAGWGRGRCWAAACRSWRCRRGGAARRWGGARSAFGSPPRRPPAARRRGPPVGGTGGGGAAPPSRFAKLTEHSDSFLPPSEFRAAVVETAVQAISELVTAAVYMRRNCGAHMSVFSALFWDPPAIDRTIMLLYPVTRLCVLTTKNNSFSRGQFYKYTWQQSPENPPIGVDMDVANTTHQNVVVSYNKISN